MYCCSIIIIISFLCLSQVFDEDGSGRMDFCEYMMAVQSSKLETPEDKLKWIFRIYDKVRLNCHRCCCCYGNLLLGPVQKSCAKNTT